MARNRTICPSVQLQKGGKRWDTSRLACEEDADCACANPAFVREMVNVTVSGRPCYACEPKRPLACTEASDQCTPEACECADPSTHTKHSAMTVDGNPCFYCEPLGGHGAGFGMNELGVAALVVVALLAWHLGKRPPVPRGSLRLARRQGDRSRAIRVQQEPLPLLEEIQLLFAEGCAAAVGLWCHLQLCAGKAWTAVVAKAKEARTATTEAAETNGASAEGARRQKKKNPEKAEKAAGKAVAEKVAEKVAETVERERAVRPLEKQQDRAREKPAAKEAARTSCASTAGGAEEAPARETRRPLPAVPNCDAAVMERATFLAEAVPRLRMRRVASESSMDLYR